MNVALEPANTTLSALVELLDGGSVEFYTGGVPASPADGATGTLLATVPLPSPCFTVASGIATANAIAPVNADEGGVVGWFRAYDSIGGVVEDGVSDEMTLSSVFVSTDQAVEIIEWIIEL